MEGPAGQSAALAIARPGPGSLTWRVQRERLILLSWGRAILLQFAHPLVAAGVAQHSTFGAEPRANRARLHRTVQAMLDLTFGTDQEAASAAARINGIHDRVNGALPEPTGAYPAGAPYSAHMPDLLLWVHATLIDSSLLVYERFVGALTPAEADQYCAEATAIGPWLGIPVATMPSSRAALNDYLATMYGTGRIVVGPTARRLGQQLVTAQPHALVRGPLLRALHWPSIGLLPPAIREAYGFPWQRSDQVGLDATAAVVRRLTPVTPPAVRYWDLARRAMRSPQWRGVLPA